MKVRKLESALNDFLDAGRFDDYCPNGLQVEASENADRVVVGVSACKELFREASERGAQAVVVHHGLLWGSNVRLVGLLARRVAFLMRSGISLLAYHLPLDAHPEVGNSAQLAAALSARITGRFARMRGGELGVVCELSEPVGLSSFLAKVEGVLGRKPQLFGPGEGAVQKIAVVTGAGGDFFEEAVALGADVFLTGEAEEWSMHAAEELGVPYVAAGHAATEALGPKALAGWISSELGLEAHFVSYPNPV